MRIQFLCAVLCSYGRSNRQRNVRIEYYEKTVKLKSMDGAYIIFGQKIEVDQLCSQIKAYEN